MSVIVTPLGPEEVLSLCKQVASLDTLLRSHIDGEWKLWAFLTMIVGGVIVALFQNFFVHRTLKNGNGKVK